MMFRKNLTDLITGFRNRTFSCEDYMRRVIQRSNEMKNSNYFTYQQQERMLELSRTADFAYLEGNPRPLEGIPMGFKDNIDILGEPNSGGTPAFCNKLPKQTATIAKVLIDSGAINSGRCNLNELAFGVTTVNPFTGPAKNFWNQDFSCGGSSGGSGGVVGADILPVALGTDTAGSIRIPASFNGAWGFKPSLNRWPGMYGIQMTWSRDVVGPIARTAKDIGFLHEIITGEKTQILKPEKVRIGVPRKHFWEKLHPEIAKQGEEFLLKLRESGFDVFEHTGFEGVQEVFDQTCLVSCNYEIFDCLDAHIKKNEYTLSVKDVINQVQTKTLKSFLARLYDDPIGYEEYKNAMIGPRASFVRNLTDYISSNNLDCLVFPTTKIPAQPLKVTEEQLITHQGQDWRMIFLMLSNVYTASVANCPAISMPWGRSRQSGVPFGMEILSLPNTDSKLLSIAQTLEEFACHK